MAVAQHGRLRLTRGPAREQQHRDPFGIAQPPDRVATLAVADFGRGAIEELLPVHRQDARDVSCPFRHAVADDDDGRRGTGQRRLQPIVGEPVAHRRERLARDRRPEERDRHRRRVHVDEADALDRPAREPRAHPPAAFEQLEEGHAAGPRTEGHPFTEAVRGHLEQHRQVHPRTVPT